jgi:AcrR family transcriptional regulator
MSPRPTPTRTDATAERFLQAGATIIDLALTVRLEARGAVPATVQYPTALDWLRIEDVLAQVRSDDMTDSKRAFRNRWGTKDEYIADLVMYALLYRDMQGTAIPRALHERAELFDGTKTLAERISAFTGGLIDELLANPRSYLLLHLAPLLIGNPELHAVLIGYTRSDQARWQVVFSELLRLSGKSLRPGWTMERLTLALNVVLDGAILRYRIDPGHSTVSAWARGNLTTDMMLAIIAGAVDLDGAGLALCDWFDAHLKL